MAIHALGHVIKELWAVIQDIFAKWLSTSDPEIAPWYAAVYLRPDMLRDFSKDWLWHANELQQLSMKWDWKDVKQAVLETKSLPRFTRLQTLKPEVYVPEEILHQSSQTSRNESPAFTSETIFEIFGYRTE